jgi:hypothetical protein
LQSKIDHLKNLILVSQTQVTRDASPEFTRRRFSIGIDHSIQFATPRKLTKDENSFFKEKFVEQQCQSIRFKCKKLILSELILKFDFNQLKRSMF